MGSKSPDPNISIYHNRNQTNFKTSVPKSNLSARQLAVDQILLEDDYQDRSQSALGGFFNTRQTQMNDSRKILKNNYAIQSQQKKRFNEYVIKPYCDKEMTKTKH